MTWKDVIGFEGLYKVSENGDIFSCLTNKILRQKINKGYPVIGIYKNGKQYVKAVHRLVAMAFIPNPHNKPEVNHLDEDKTNNHVINLNWVTGKENCNWGTRNNRVKPYLKLGPYSKRITKPKPVIGIDPITGLINYVESVPNYCKENKLSNGKIYEAINGKRKTAYGLIWFR